MVTDPSRPKPPPAAAKAATTAAAGSGVAVTQNVSARSGRRALSRLTYFAGGTFRSRTTRSKLCL